MAVTIDATVGGSAANSYCTLAEADTYHEERLHVTDWSGATDANKNSALVWATRILDYQLEWDGWPASTTQARCWPRSGLLDKNGNAIANTVIPDEIKWAEAELARWLIKSDRTADQSSDGILSIKAAPVEIAFNPNDPPVRRPLTDAVCEMVSLWGRRKFGRSAVKLVRT